MTTGMKPQHIWNSSICTEKKAESQRLSAKNDYLYRGEEYRVSEHHFLVSTMSFIVPKHLDRLH